MTITKTCNTCEHYPNDKHCIGCEWDKCKGENSKWELKKNPIVIERKVLDKIRAEIEKEYNLLSATRANETLELGECLGLKMSLKIIDKYRAAERR